MVIGFNKPFYVGMETSFIEDAVKREQISGDGYYTQRCQQFFQKKYGFRKTLLTTSCTDALEMAAILLDIAPGDEVIVPSYTFVSSANAFVLRGARIIFADSREDHPNLDTAKLEDLITEKTKAIVVVHYAGIACDMDEVMRIANKYGVFVVEDAAQAINSYYKDKPLGGIGHLGCMSFHETKNITSGEGGMLIINDERFAERAQIIWEKGTNRSAFFRGETCKYEWMDVGSSFLPSEITAAFLYAQLDHLDLIQNKRKKRWEYYYKSLKKIAGDFILPIPVYATNNAHMFSLVCRNSSERNTLITELNARGIQAISHYLPLHTSKFYKDKHDNRLLENALHFSKCLIRLPFYADITEEQQDFVIDAIREIIATLPSRIPVVEEIRN